MNTAEANFGEIEFGANRALAYAILATETENGYVTLYRLSKVFSELEKFAPFLTPDYVESLTIGQKRRLRLRMQDTHQLLTQFLRSTEVERFKRFPPLQGFVNRLQEGTEDLAKLLDGMPLVEASS
jgi:hypothetical protein